MWSGFQDRVDRTVAQENANEARVQGELRAFSMKVNNSTESDSESNMSKAISNMR
jgi:hypothetical protein